jgi:hypothetical protein
MGELSSRVSAMAAQRAGDRSISYENALQEIHNENPELRDQARYENYGQKVRHEKIGDVTVLVIGSPKVGGSNG